MSGSGQESRSIEIWTSVHRRLRAEVDPVVFDKWLEPLTFAGLHGNAVHLAAPTRFQRDWVENTFGERILALWQEESSENDAEISEVEILVQPKSRKPPKDAEAAAAEKAQRQAETAKADRRWTAAIKRARERGRGDKRPELEKARKQLGKVGVWSRTPYFGEPHEATSLAATAEELGYQALWIPGFDGGHIFERCGLALKATSKLTIATGIVNIWRHEPAEVAETVHTLRAISGDRFLLGLGSSHKYLIGDDYDKISPIAKMSGYLDALDAGGTPEEDRLLGALGPKMLELAAERTAGSHPCFMPPEHTAAAREVLGAGPLLMPELGVILETDPVKARTIARSFASLYYKGPNYNNNLRRFGYTDEDFAGEGSDRLIDAIIAWGDPATIAARVQAHLDAGADHVAVHSRGLSPEVDVWRELAPFLL